MITLNNVGKWKRCNLWIDEIPEIQYRCLDSLNGTIVKNDWIKWDDVSYTLELRVIGRDCSNYALLGLRYEYEYSGELAIKVNVSEFDGEIIDRNISSLSDEIHSGLPLEYAKVVFDVTKNYLENIPCSQGKITFDIAAHGYVGSSQSIFELVAGVLLQLLANDNKTDIEKIEKITYNQLNPND